MDSLVLLKTYHNKYDAEAAVGLLKSNGMEAILSSDISLGDNQVLVKKGDLEKARETIKLLEESLLEGEVKQIGEAAIQVEETPPGKRRSAKDFITVIPFIIAAIFLCSSVFKGINKPRYYKQRYYGEGLDCKQPNPGSKYTVCKEYYKNKRVRTAVIYKGKKLHGSLKEFFADGGLKIEWTYVDDKLDGPFKEHYANGQLKAEGAFRNDETEGEYKEYYDTGELKRVSYSEENNVLDFHWKTFHRSGKLVEDVVLKAGVRFDAQGKSYEGIAKISYENGSPWEVFSYKKGMLEGASKSYYENGNLEKEENYRNGIRHGEAKSYFPNGNLQSVSQYRKDALIAVKEYDQKGHVIFERH